MADERIVVELALQGVQETVRQIQSVISAQSDLLIIQESSGVRQRQVYDSVAASAQAAAQAQVDAAKRAAEQIAQAEAASTKAIVEAAAQQAAARRNAAAQAVAPAVQQQIRAAAFPTPSNLTPQRLQVAVDAAQFTAARNAIVAQQTAAQTLQGRLSALGTVIKANVASLGTFTTSVKDNAVALGTQGQAASGATRNNITYLSVLSAIHAASFLATNQTFSMIGSFVTLTAAFGKVSVVGAVLGAALGGVLAIFGQINQAMEQITAAAETGAKVLAGFAALTGGAAVAAGVASVKVASSVESQLAAVRAFGGATADQLGVVEQQAGQFARQFGIAAADVVQATALFSKAGGSVEEAIAGATEAIVKLQIASAGELSAAQSATVLSAAMKQFNLTGAESGHIADVLTAAFQGSALSATGVQQAFVQAAPGAAALGISIDDLGAAIALIGDRLVKGTITGTAFKQAILDLISPSAKAQEIFKQYGITVKDASGNTLPLVDIVDQLNQAFGKMVDEEGNVIKQQDAATIAALGGARAFLAFNVLTEQGATGLQKYRTALDAVSATDIANVLLLPLNKQLEVLTTNIQEVGRAFGGPLLQPIRNATVAAIGFVQQTIPHIQLLGEMLGVVVTGQGFGALQQKISELVSNSTLAIFLVELTNTFRNIKDVIVSQVIPAIGDLLVNLGLVASEPGRLTDMVTIFGKINEAIQFVGAAAAVAIRHLSAFLTNLIHNEGAGRAFRDTLGSIATLLITNLVTGIATSTAFLVIALKVMEGMGNLIRTHVLPNLDKFGQALILIGRIAQGVALSINAPFVELRAGLEFVRAIAEGVGIEKALERAKVAALDARGPLGGAADGFVNLGEALSGLAKGSQTSINEVDKILAGASASANATLKSYEDLAGEIPTALANVIAEIQQTQKEAQAAATLRGGGAAAAPVDTKAIDAAQKRIAEATSDVSRRLADLQTDAGQKAKETAKRALDRIAELQQTTAERILETIQTAQDRIKDLFRNVDERRADRQTLDDFKQGQEERLTAWQRELDKEDQAHARSLDNQRTDRQRNNEDIARGKEQELADDETHFSRFQDIAQRAFQRVQQAREVAFSRAQDIEATVFQRGLDREARAREFAQALAQAKTPEERQRLIQQQQQAVQDTAFRQGQEDKLTKFRLGQEDKRVKFTQSQEEQAVGFRNGLEDASLAHRRANELVLLDFRRKAEDIERGIREREDDAELQRRLDREDILTARRRADAQALQQEQDRLENIRNEEQAQRIRDEALQTVNKEIGKAQEQIDKVIEDATRALDEQATDVEKQTRNIINTLIDLKDDFPPDVLAAIGDQLAGSLTEAGSKAEALKGQLKAIRAQRLGEIQIEGATAAANLQMLGQQQLQQFQAPTQPSIPLGVLAVQTIQAASFVFPPGLEGPLSIAVLNALRQADIENLSLMGPEQPPPPPIDWKAAAREWFK